MRPPVPETILVNNQIAGTDQGGLDTLMDITPRSVTGERVLGFFPYLNFEMQLKLEEGQLALHMRT